MLNHCLRSRTAHIIRLCPVVSVVPSHTVDDFQVEVSEDVFKTYKAGPLSVLVKYPLGNLLVRLASAEGKWPGRCEHGGLGAY